MRTTANLRLKIQTEAWILMTRDIGQSVGHQLVKKLYLRRILLTVYFSFRYLRDGASSAAYNVHTSKI